MATIPRELVRWLQTLDLPSQIRHPKRDMANGYLAAEICARYWSNVDLHQYDNGTSTKTKESNWKALRRVLAKNNASLPDHLVADVIAAKNDAGLVLLETLYSMFTSRMIQQAPPLEMAELNQVPTYVKAQRMTDAQQAQAQAHQDMLRQQQQQAHEEEQAREMEREAAAEAERRRQQQKLNASAKKPKPQNKVQAIRAAEEADTAEDQPKLQFSGVTVKPLSSQALARLGVGRSSAGRRPAGPSGSGAQEERRTNVGDGVLVSISTAIESMLRDSAAPSWAVPPGMTYVEYFAQQHQRLPPNTKDSVWNTLFANIEDTATWLVGRPADIGAFAAVFMPSVSTETVQTQLGRSHFAFTGLDAKNSAAYTKSVFAAMSASRLSYAMTCLSRHVVPLAVPALASIAKNTATAERREDALACVDALMALAGCAVADVVLSESRVRQFLSSMHQALVGAVAARADPRFNPVDQYAAFLFVVELASMLPASGVVPSNTAGSSADAVQSEFDAESPEKAPSVDASESAATGANATDDAEVPSPLLVLHSGVASAMHYHATAALHHVSTAVRLRGLVLLTRLAECGRVQLVLPRHIDRLTALTEPDALELLAQHPDAISQTLALLRHSVGGLAWLRQRLNSEGAADADEDEVCRQALETDGTVQQVLLHVSGTPDASASFFQRATTSNRLTMLAEVGAAAPFCSAAPSADGEPSPQQYAVHNLMQGLMQLPAIMQLFVTRGANETVPSAAELTSSFGVVQRRNTAPTVFHGAPDAWPCLPVVSMLAQMISAADITPPPLPAPTKASRPKLSPTDADEAAALENVSHLVELLFQFVVRRNKPLCPAAHVATAWEVMRVLHPALSKAVKYHDQLLFLRQRNVPVPSESVAHPAMLVIARRCRVITARFFAEWSGTPHAKATAAGTIEALADAIHSEEPSVDEHAAGADRVFDWWSGVVPPASA